MWSESNRSQNGVIGNYDPKLPITRLFGGFGGLVKLTVVCCTEETDDGEEKFINISRRRNQGRIEGLCRLWR